MQTSERTLHFPLILKSTDIPRAALERLAALASEYLQTKHFVFLLFDRDLSPIGTLLRKPVYGVPLRDSFKILESKKLVKTWLLSGYTSGFIAYIRPTCGLTPCSCITHYIPILEGLKTFGVDERRQTNLVTDWHSLTRNTPAHPTIRTMEDELIQRRLISSGGDTTATT